MRKLGRSKSLNARTGSLSLSEMSAVRGNKKLRRTRIDSIGPAVGREEFSRGRGKMRQINKTACSRGWSEGARLFLFDKIH